MIHPPGSRPGIISLAMIPAINPKMIQAMIPKTSSFTATAEPSCFICASAMYNAIAQPVEHAERHEARKRLDSIC